LPDEGPGRAARTPAYFAGE